ncbi:hypothetical protein SAMN05421824_3010 [Hyunsoonleella jejuensis]|uniref:Uncharacterized protein n=1 Tax=Hyunsoonleella jejuensis TaxID=419940 RepID=A0A1H9LEY5_9FLAO|nr:hypothetical protein [Hyunsoonleella jejuensis]SER09695.1 hypothetical protein SAMN05421824_3010 [Hyunsoonleella jejuensis]
MTNSKLITNVFIFTLSIFSVSIGFSQGRSCVTCKGSGSVYVERKVHNGYNTTYSESEIYIYKNTEKTYSTEGSYETCGRCNGTGYIKSRNTYKREIQPIPSDFRGKVKHHYETKYLRGIPVQIEATSIANIYKVKFKSGNYYTEYIYRKGNQFSILADKENFFKAKILRGENSDIGIAIITREKVENNGYTIEQLLTTIYDKNGKFVADFMGKAYGTGANMIWKPVETHKGYALHSFPNLKKLTKTYNIDESSRYGKFFEKYGYIDLNYKDKTSIVNQNGEYIGPKGQTFIGIDQESGYLYFIDKQRFINIISPKGQLILSTEPRQKNCGELFNCIELDLNHIPATVQHPSINNIKPIKVTKINSKIARLNGRGFVDMSDFDQSGWASFKLLFNENKEFIINKNSAIAYKGNKRLKDYYNENEDYEKVTEAESALTHKSNEENNALATYVKNGKIGGHVNWSGKQKDFKPKYKSIKIYHDNVVVFENMDGEYGFYIKAFRDGSSHFEKAQYEKVLAPTGNRVLVKEEGIWHYIQKYSSKYSVHKSEVSRLERFKHTLKDYNKYTHLINVYEAGIEHPESFPNIPGINVKDITKIEPYNNNSYQKLITYNSGYKYILYKVDGKNFIYSKKTGFTCPAFISRNTLLLPYKNEKSGKYHIVEVHNDGRREQLRNSSSFTFDEIVFMKNKYNSIRTYGKNQLGIFTFEEVDLVAKPGGQRSTGIFPVPIVLF